MSDLNENIQASNQGTPCPEQPSKDIKRKNFISNFIEQIEFTVIVLVAIILCFTFLGQNCTVNGASMENTLYNGEMIVVSDFLYTPERNDIVVFHQTGDTYNEPIVKRVIGLPGEIVNIKYFDDSMQVSVTDVNGNTQILEEEYIKYEKPIRYRAPYSVYVEEGTVFVMGDNRNNSADSRTSAIGLVDTRRILGKIVFRVTPFSRFGTVK